MRSATSSVFSEHREKRLDIEEVSGPMQRQITVLAAAATRPPLSVSAKQLSARISTANKAILLSGSLDSATATVATLRSSDLFTRRMEKCPIDPVIEKLLLVSKCDSVFGKILCLATLELRI